MGVHVVRLNLVYGIPGIFEMPPENMKPIKDCLPVTIIFDQIRDPGNFGTLLRTAAAVGCKKVMAVKGRIKLLRMSH